MNRRLFSIVAASLVTFVVACGGSGADESGAPSAPGGGATTFGAGANENNTGTGTGAGGEGSGSGCGGAADDPAAAETVGRYMDTLPYNIPTGEKRRAITDAILRACSAFGPPPKTNTGWKNEYCWAHLTAAIEKESSYDPSLSVKDSYSTRGIAGTKANDPTVGLLQIRFSSTVRDYASLGPLDRLACVGCKIPDGVTSHVKEQGDSAYWAATGPSENMSMMQDIACNVGLGAWYYYVNGTSNGKPTAPTYLSAYCKGQGTAGNLVTGLLSHLGGPDRGKGVIEGIDGVNALKATNSYGYEYVTTIKGWFDKMIPPPPGTHPFFLRLEPNPSQYCR